MNIIQWLVKHKPHIKEKLDAEHKIKTSSDKSNIVSNVNKMLEKKKLTSSKKGL